MKIHLSSGSRTSAIYGGQQIDEGFNCSYELNPAFEGALERGGLRVVGRGERGEARIVELPEHRFFIGTLFQPQLSSVQGAPHPLIVAFLDACLEVVEERARAERDTGELQAGSTGGR